MRSERYTAGWILIAELTFGPVKQRLNNRSNIGQGFGFFEQAESLLEFFFAARVMAIEEFAYLMEGLMTKYWGILYDRSRGIEDGI